MTLRAFLRNNPPPVARPRPYVPASREGMDARQRAFHVRLHRRLHALTRLLAPEDFDWRVVQKWQYASSQLTPDELDVLRSLGAWLKAQGVYTPPKALYRVVGVEGMSSRWPHVPDEELTRYGIGLRSWSRMPGGLDAFCQTEECLELVWRAPPAKAVLLDGNALEAWLLAQRPELHRALADSGDGAVGLDRGEYLADPRAFVVLRKGYGDPKDHGIVGEDRPYLHAYLALRA